MSEPKTIRVRAAVAVDEHGHYMFAGWSGGTDKDMAQNAREFFERAEGNECVHFVVADVPLPESVTVEGEVKP